MSDPKPPPLVLRDAFSNDVELHANETRFKHVPETKFRLNIVGVKTEGYQRHFFDLDEYSAFLLRERIDQWLSRS